jgi:hypothetical protein
LNSDTLSTIPLGNAFFRMKKENLLKDASDWGQIFILDLATFVSSTFRSLPTDFGLSSEARKWLLGHDIITFVEPLPRG